MEVERWWEIYDAEGEAQRNGGDEKASLGKFRPKLFRYILLLFQLFL